MKTSRLRICLYFVVAVVLLTGLGSAVLIYRAADDPNSVSGYETEGGYAYPIMPEDSKMYRHDLELYGGKAIVLADDLRRWVAGLWHGKSLAFTVAFCSVFISLGFFAAARRLPSDLKSDGIKTGGSKPTE